MYSFFLVLEIIWSLFRNEIFEYRAYNPFIHFSASKNIEVAGYAGYPTTAGCRISGNCRPDNPACRISGKIKNPAG